MVFESLDGHFGGIAAVEIRGRQLEINLFGVHEVHQGFGALIVQVLEFGV